MKLKLFTIAGAALLALSSLASAGDLFQIFHRDSLITATYDQLETFFELQGDHAATRAYYNRLNANGSLYNLQPGDVVNVVGYPGGGIAKISWGGGAHHAYIATNDLTSYLGSR
jgi:hypothetical protein